MQKFEKMFETQKKFTELFFKTKYNVELKDILSNKKLLDSQTKEYILALIVEATEILTTINWKQHTTKMEDDIKDNFLEESIDVMKYLLGLLILHGFSIDEIYEKFIEKSGVVESKYNQEIILNDIKNGTKNIVFVDIDGVLAEWPGEFIKFLNKELNTEYTNLVEIETQLDKLLYYTIKEKYRLSGIKQTLKVKNGAKELLKVLKSKDYCIVLLTSRPYKTYYRIYSDTLIWLKNNDLIHDAIFWADDKEKYIIQNFKDSKVKFIIEDDINNANKLSENGFKVFLYPNKLGYGDTLDKKLLTINKNITIINELQQLESYI